MKVPKVGTVVTVVGGAGGTIFIGNKIKDFMKVTYIPEIQSIYDFEEENGGCNFWIVEKTNERTGWYPNEAERSLNLRTTLIGEHSKSQTKLEKLKETLDSKDESFSKICRENSNKRVLLRWNASGNDKWTAELPGSEWDIFKLGEQKYKLV